ncbi:carboxypeptidase-like regulatory domain-containing protein, partial [Salmonella enterica]|uniref:carboxypeptidase-like regulatory domain-containing protein n=1 Tax=Salmonella enterica TaxID=28901 RepID=UPI0020A561F3
KNNSASEEENTTTEAPVFRTVTGVVSDDKGEPLVGASVILKNTSRYSMTNERGAFSIEVDNDNAILVVSYTGYETKEINVG